MDIDLSKIPTERPDFTDVDTGEDVYVVHQAYGRFQFRVPGGTKVRKQDTRWPSARVGQVFPNIEARDGAIVIPICDLVEAIVERTEPAVLAKELWANEEVREEFIECATNRWSEGGIGDADRRKLLHKLKAEVHDTRLDKAVSTLVTLEHAERQRWLYERDLYAFRQRYAVILGTIENRFGAEARTVIEEAHGGAFEGNVENRKDFDIGQKHWNESRKLWHDDLLKLFAPPEEPPAAAQIDPPATSRIS